MCGYQRILLLAPPTLNFLFPRNSLFDVAERFPVHQQIAEVAAGERMLTAFIFNVLLQPSRQIIRDAGVEHGTLGIGSEINEIVVVAHQFCF